jgi:hypothetical protein
MPPLTGLGERCAPRATWSRIDEHTQPGQGSNLSASLAPRSWLEQAFRHPDHASSSQGCTDSPPALFLFHLMRHLSARRTPSAGTFRKMNDVVLVVITPSLLTACSLVESLGRTPSCEWRRQKPGATIYGRLHNGQPWRVCLAPGDDHRTA